VSLLRGKDWAISALADAGETERHLFLFHLITDHHDAGHLWFSETSIFLRSFGLPKPQEGLATPMLSVLFLLLSTLFSVFRSRAALQVEILALRHQIGVLHWMRVHSEQRLPVAPR
jgi:hypothetical protein